PHHAYFELGEALDQRLRAPHRDRGKKSHEVVAAERLAANGSVIRKRNSIRNSESPKLYSNRPAVTIATTTANPAAASHRRLFAEPKSRLRSIAATATNHSQAASAGKPRSAATWTGTLC